LVVGFIFCQAYFIAYASNQSRIKNIELSDSLLKLNNSLSRFIPQNFIDLMGKSNITEVSLGNCTEQEMTIMFSDIRSFTTISEQLSSGDSFRFINDYLQVMGPIIKSNKGFIDKYIGDGIMALFPNHPNDAVKASLEMMAALEKFNQLNVSLNKPQIAIGIGLHYGMVVLGTVGEPDRMDTTVISDAVNLAARIESLTKQYQVPIIISGETFDKLNDNLMKRCSCIGKATVKGKSIETRLYQVQHNENELTIASSSSGLINEVVSY
jgi:class 3 adenylate cyclase